jgi:hypothetical protein
LLSFGIRGPAENNLPFIAALLEVAVMLSASLYFLFSGYGAVALMVAFVVAKVASASLTVTPIVLAHGMKSCSP